MKSISKKKKIFLITLPIPAIIVAGFSPILIALLAGFIAKLCGVDTPLAGGEPPDIPMIGDLLFVMFMMHWLAIATIPAAAVALVVYLLIYIVLVTLILMNDPDRKAKKQRQNQKIP